MFVQKGDQVILIAANQESLKKYIGSEWDVISIDRDVHPASALISNGILQANVYIKNLDVLPPKNGPFDYNEQVKVIKKYTKSNLYICNLNIINAVGSVRSFDSRNGYYYIMCPNGEAGWFPINCLVPVDYKGEHFFYPHDSVKYKNKICLVSKIRKSKFKWGQVLYIDGLWVPSTDVEKI